MANRCWDAALLLLFSSTYGAWCQLSDEMYSRADAHRSRSYQSSGLGWSCRGRDPGSGFAFRSLGNAFQQEAILELRQLLDEHTKRKRPVRPTVAWLLRRTRPCHDASPVFSLLPQFDGAIERTGKLVTLNWNEQLKVRKTDFGSVFRDETRGTPRGNFGCHPLSSGFAFCHL